VEELLGCLLEPILGRIVDRPVEALVEAPFKFGKWVGELRIEKPKLFWVAIGLGCWTGLVAAVPWVAVSYWTALDISAGLPPPSTETFMGLLMYSTLCGSFPLVFLFAVPAWLALAWYARRSSVRTEELADFAPKPEEFADFEPNSKRITDFSPMPQEFADFERMLEEAKEERGRLVCLECWHYNPVGQTQCEECGAWVPQTAKDRWTYG
jgi:hypothetical protein